MYHYVRPIIGSNFPNLNVLEFNKFQKQLDFLQKNYHIVSSNQIINAIVNQKPLPPNSCWLTFDDGYKDHYKYVFPELVKRNISGAFFPPRVAIKEKKLLNANSIHHILSCCNNIDNLVDELQNQCIKFTISKNQFQKYKEKYCFPNRFDDKKTIFFKRMLQHVLPEEIRNKILTDLFEKFVGISESELSDKLYMNINEISEMVKNGMHFGSHGSEHYWLDRISYQKQKNDILSSLEFLKEVGMPMRNWIMCYPYGAYNQETISLVKELGASIGITTDSRKANLSVDNPLTLPRLDTNDLPQ